MSDNGLQSGPTEKTVIVREFSRFAEPGDEPYYPVNTAEDRAKLLRYRELARKETPNANVLFGGRLGTAPFFTEGKALAGTESAED